MMKLMSRLWICFFLLIGTANAQPYDQNEAADRGWGVSAWEPNDGQTHAGNQTQTGSQNPSEEVSECERLGKMVTAIREQRAYFYPSEATRARGRMVSRKIRFDETRPDEMPEGESSPDNEAAPEESQPQRGERVYLDEHELKLFENDLKALNCPAH